MISASLYEDIASTHQSHTVVHHRVDFAVEADRVIERLGFWNQK